jgi:hypothetical protein
MSPENDPIKPAISDVKLAANRANALKSTGPKTPAGKIASRGNAIKHGLYAETIPIEGENGELFDTRFNAWSTELNPFASEAADYIIAQLVRKSIRLDRCHLVHDATIANLARSALQVRAEGRACLVEDLSRMLLTDTSDIAVRRLREFPEGCEYLIREWQQLAPALIDPPHWDDIDELNSSILMGRLRSLRRKAPGQLVLQTLAIAKNREVATKLANNEYPASLHWTEKYNSQEAHQRDRDEILGHELKAIHAKAEIEARIEREIADLRARKLELEERDNQEMSQASLRARFDDTDKGKLMHRHEGDLERGFFRGLKEVRDIGRFAMQVNGTKPITPERPWLETRPPELSPARNEATARPVRKGLAGWEPIEEKGYSEVNVSITPKMDPKRKQ